MLAGDEFYITDHLVGGKKVLPGVAYLEIAYVAGEIAGEAKVAKLTDIVWASPVIVDDGRKEINIGLYPAEDKVEFEVSSASGCDKVIHCQGRILFEDSDDSKAAIERVDVDAVHERCKVHIAGNDYYRDLNGNVLYFGESFRSIQDIYYNKSEAISKLRIIIESIP